MDNFNFHLLILYFVPVYIGDALMHVSVSVLIMHTKTFLTLFNSCSIFFSVRLFIYLPHSHTDT